MYVGSMGGHAGVLHQIDVWMCIHPSFLVPDDIGIQNSSGYIG